MTAEEYCQLLNDIELSCLDDDLKALHCDREWQKSYTERAVNVQLIRLLRDVVKELQQWQLQKVSSGTDSGGRMASGDS